MENLHEFRILSVDSVHPLTGWWFEERIEPMSEDEELQVNFHPLFGIASVSVRSYREVEMKLSLPVTLAQLNQLNYDAITGQGSTYTSQFNRTYRHDFDFEVLGKKLRDDAENRGEI